MFKRLILITALFVGFQHPIVAQIDETILPKTSTWKASLFSKLDEVLLPAFSNALAGQRDEADVKKGKAPKFARSQPVNINPYNAGSWTELPDGGGVWRMQITSAGALGLVPVFEKLYLPAGASLHIYMPSGEETIGAFTHANTPEPRGLCTGLIHGESCIVEYYEPAEHRGEGILQLQSIGHAYRWVQPLRRGISPGKSDTCEVNVNCSEGANWQDQKRSVVLILIVDNEGEGYCSGSLLNNAKDDCTPYVLSAQHCGEFSKAADYNNWVFYFNYEAATCTDSSGSLNHFINGCTKLADSDDDGGDYGSDFLLMRLSNSIPPSFNAFLSGWDRSGAIPDSTVCIHHPQGDVKKIYTSSTSPKIVSWVDIVDSTHWDVTWSVTAHGHGITEEASSGSPLFNQQGHIIGSLSGGDSYCDEPLQSDQFGRFYFHWDMNDVSDSVQLKPWLDPDSTGILMLDGRNASCITAIAEIHKPSFTFELFPNPTSGAVQLVFDEANLKTIRVFDLFGQEISEANYSSKVVKLDLTTLNRGIYLVEARSSLGTSVKRITLN
ncbi:MAG: T9SS type A sorting domain-containing protein [Bacteroidetes bacterium]|nr:T9SS type A sorting domain-containing protein [Bacteroidota bacterium]